ncbi:MAG TPA: RNA methyltransferase [bacterium]|nr:RNA methyltransferase [bacterium]
MDARPATEEELDRFRSLRSADVPEGHFIGDGDKVIRRMITAGCVVRVLGLEERVAKLPLPAGVEVLLASREQLEKVVGYRLHAGIMALGRTPPEKPITGTLHLALDGLANAENVGAILRTCAAFGVDGVIVGERSSSPWHRRAVRVSMGAPLVVPVHHVRDLAATIAPMNAWAAHMHGEKRDFLDVDYTQPVCLVVGGEADGVSDRVLAVCRGTIWIPMASSWDCLNVAASTAVLLAEVARQRR